MSGQRLQAADILIRIEIPNATVSDEKKYRNRLNHLINRNMRPLYCMLSWTSKGHVGRVETMVLSAVASTSPPLT